MQLGAMLGPVKQVQCEAFYCSPLMSRPKEGDNRRVIMDLSLPQGNALNDYVTKDCFDCTRFVLKLTSIDNIVNNIIKTGKNPVVFKGDVARVFRNLPVNPVDTLKLGIKWNNKFYLDKSVAFG